MRLHHVQKAVTQESSYVADHQTQIAALNRHISGNAARTHKASTRQWLVYACSRRVIKHLAML